LNIQVNEKKPGVFIVSLAGDLDMSSSPQVRNILLPIFRKKVSHLIVDLAEVPYIDSSGIATFVGTPACPKRPSPVFPGRRMPNSRIHFRPGLPEKCF